MQHPAPESSVDRNCEQYRAPVADQTQYENLTRDLLDEQWSQERISPKAVEEGIVDAIGLDKRCGSEARTSWR